MRSSFLILPLALLGGNVIAQEQTAEGAQMFLSATLPGNGYVPAMFSSVIESWDNSVPEYWRYRFTGTSKIMEVRSPDRCRTVISFDPSGLFVEVNTNEAAGWTGWRRRSEDRSEALSQGSYKEGLMGVVASDISWDNVIEVKTSNSGSDVLVVHNGLEKPTLVRVGAKDMAARVAYAMEFLKISCDKAAGTGF